MSHRKMPAAELLEQPDTNPLDFAVAQRDRNVIDMVRNAIEWGDVILAFQPVVQTIAPERPAFYEGLIRVLDETGRIIPAKDFINTIEMMELGRQLDCFAIEMGCATLHESPNLRLAVNMSARSIGYPEWMRRLDHGLALDPTVADRLILEITESSAMHIPEIVCTFMEDLQDRGISFALDDFGAGHTAFRYLREFHFDLLKIDGQFICGIASNPDNQALTKALIGIAEQFGMFTVAETVETAVDAEYLATLGIDCMQGCYFGAPTINPPWKLPPRAEHIA